MASRRLCISAGHACDAHPVRPRGPRGGQANRRALGWEGGGGGAGRACGGGGGASTCPVMGDSSRLPAGGPHACQQRVEGMAPTLVHSAQGGGTFSIHVHASTGWKDWASTPVHASTGWRVRWVLRHCSQPPPLYQSRGYESAAIAAPGPQCTYRCWCTRCMVAALALLLHCSQPPPRYHRGAMGVLLQPHSSCSARTAATAARVSLQFWCCIRTVAKPATLPIEGPRGAAGAALLRLPTYCSAAAGVVPHRWYCSCTAAHPCPNTNRGAEGGEGQRGRGARGGGGHFSAGWRVLFSTPVYTSTGRRVCAPLLCTSEQGDRSLLLCASAQGAR